MREKYKGIFRYGIFGVCTTMINLAVYDICSSKIKLGTIGSTVIAWILAVIFAFFTNRKYVFESTSITYIEKWGEFFRFICSRLSTGVIDAVGMYVFVDILQFHGMMIKVGMNILVVLLNYITSQTLVFH